MIMEKETKIFKVEEHLEESFSHKMFLLWT